MTLEHLAATRYRAMPWKNGGGITHEIAAEASTPPLWRLSVATIERDGPFSDFSGYDRTILTLDGRVDLEVDGAPHPLGACEPFSFRGESRASATVREGPARDFNVMTRRDAFAHDVEIASGRTVLLVDDDEIVFVYSLLGDCRVDGLRCARGDTVRLDAVDRVEIDADEGARACIVRITPR